MKGDVDVLESHLQRQLTHSREFFWHKLRWRAVRSLLPADEPFELLDVGAGAGLLGEYLQRDRPLATYRFVEPLESLTEHLISTFGPEADWNGLGAYTGARFVTLLDVIEHIEDDFGFCADLAAKLDPGATVVITVPALKRLWSEWDTALGHYRRYDKALLRAPLEAAGLEVLELSFLFPEMLPAALLRQRQERRHAREGESAEFPDLPPLANRVLHGVGSATLVGRGHWPAGTSLLAVARRR
jgi:hypothetical protein